MCGIFGYTGKDNALKILLHGLQRLEYRGYDSAGVFVGDDGTDYLLKRSVGKVAKLSSLVKGQESSNYTRGIAHTRWATHGGVTVENTHPHVSNDGKWVVVHNGIIENYAKIKKELLQEGYTFSSETDTEVVANLLQASFTGDALTTVQSVQNQIRGAYAFLIMHKDYPDKMIGVRLGSPLLFGYNDSQEFFFSSDSQALSGYVEKLIYLEDGDILYVHEKDYTIFSNGKVTQRNAETFDQEALEASKGSYKHFMLKEIYEQPNIIKRIFKGRINFDNHTMHTDAFHGMNQESYNHIVTVACGTAFNAGMLGCAYFQNLSKVFAHPEIASEYENKPFFVSDKKLHLFVSQSGETADSLDCLKMVKDQGGKSLGVVNVVGSSIARLTDSGLFLRAGAEIGVASTKAFLAQSACLLMISLFLGKRRGMRLTKYQQILRELEHLPSYIDIVLDQSDQIRSIAMDFLQYKNFFFLGRGYQHAIACESSLKYKEITYLHSEAYPAGELKHGSLALIDEHMPTVFNLPHDEMFEKNISSMHEIQAREGKVCVISDKRIESANWQITIPETIDEIYPFLTAVAGQLLAYHVADLLGNDIDKPKNLAKSVTVK